MKWALIGIVALAVIGGGGYAIYKLTDAPEQAQEWWDEKKLDNFETLANRELDDFEKKIAEHKQIQKKMKVDRVLWAGHAELGDANFKEQKDTGFWTLYGYEHEIEHRPAGVGAFLGHGGDIEPARKTDLALIGGNLTQNQPEQTGLPGSVASDHPHPPAGIDGGGELVEQQPGSAAQGEIGEIEHDWGRRRQRISLAALGQRTDCGERFSLSLGSLPDGRRQAQPALLRSPPSCAEQEPAEVSFTAPRPALSMNVRFQGFAGALWCGSRTGDR